MTDSPKARKVILSHGAFEITSLVSPHVCSPFHPTIFAFLPAGVKVNNTWHIVIIEEHDVIDIDVIVDEPQAVEVTDTRLDTPKAIFVVQGP